MNTSHRTRSLRDECQELVRLKRVTQEEVDELLGKPPPKVEVPQSMIDDLRRMRKFTQALHTVPKE